MNTVKRSFLIAGGLCLLAAIVELILCFYGPFVLDIKSTTFIFPLYADVLSDEENQRLTKVLNEEFAASRRYLVVDHGHGAARLTEQGKSLEEYLKKRSKARFTEAARLIGSEQFVFGYILSSGEEGGYELFCNAVHSKTEVKVKSEKIRGNTFEELIENIPGLVQKLDGEKKSYSLSEMLYFYALFFYAVFGALLLVQAFSEGEGKLKSRFFAFVNLRIPEFLFIYTLFLFTFSFIYASNANMDYVQTFMATGGNLRLAENADLERFRVSVRYLPLLIAAAGAFAFFRIKRAAFGLDRFIGSDFRVLWALPFTVLSAFLISVAFPSFINIEGFSLLAFVALIPLIWMIDKNTYGPAVFYGVIFGCFKTIFTNFWLGTFSLVSLQSVMIIFIFFYTCFMFPAVWLHKRIKRFNFLILPLAWTLFDYLHSLGFVGYPWGLTGAASYSLTPLIQVASITGVWGLTFLVVLSNTVLAGVVKDVIRKRKEKLKLPVAVMTGLFGLAFLYGFIYLGMNPVQKEGTKKVKIAMIQHSMDPRKHTLTEAFEVLKELTDKALVENPDIVFWPEGAFNLDIKRFASSNLVKELKSYITEKNIWLLTGGLETDMEKLAAKKARFPGNIIPEGENEPAYNSSTLLNPDAEIVEVHYKMHLVPFTEYFPYEKELPWLHKMLKEFDINWWLPGETLTVFEHPDFTFFTPICFEDVFPVEVRDFVREGADVISVISNDYWSLSPVEGTQHAIMALFRAVENRRPLLRITTSGLSCYVDPAGRIRETMPHYESAYRVVEVTVGEEDFSLYTLWGDWFPIGAGILLLVALVLSFTPLLKED